MTPRNLIFFGGMFILGNSLSFSLQAANQESVKKLETLLPRESAEQSKSLDLSGVDMRSFNLCASNKDEKINFKNANLEGANFAGKEICNMNFEGANLKNASFERARKICNVNFEGANLKNASFERASITSCNFHHVKGPANFTGAFIKYSGFNNATLENSSFDSAVLESTGFDYANLKNTIFNKASLVAVNFYAADLTGYSREEARMDRTNFERSKGTTWFD
jgi:uncharacterized protein YjbI with pentapeptide repeats